MQRLTFPLLVILTLLCWAAATWLRLRGLDQVIVSSDSLGPYLRALAFRPEFLEQGLIPRPPNPESGDGLWLLAVPLVHLADSLHDLFRLRFALGAGVAPLGLLAAWVWAAPDDAPALWRQGSPAQWSAALAAGAVLAVDPGLSDTLVSGARSYGGPELAALLCFALGLAWHGDRLALFLAAAALALGVDHHPMAAGLALGCLFLLPGLAERQGPGALFAAFLFLLLLVVPRLLRLGILASCGPDPMLCLAQVAQSNVDPAAQFSDIARVAVHDRFMVDLVPGVAAGLGLGLVLSRPWLGAGGLALGGALGMLGLGAFTEYLHGYHLRILAAPLTVAAAVGLARLWPLALAWAAYAAVLLFPKLPVGPDPGAVDRHDLLAQELPALQGPLWVEGLWWDGRAVLDASGVVLAAVLQGQDRDRFHTGPDSAVVLLSIGAGPTPPGERLIAGAAGDPRTEWSAWYLRSSAEVRAFLDEAGGSPRGLGGAYDWLTALHPDEASLEAVDWAAH